MAQQCWAASVRLDFCWSSWASQTSADFPLSSHSSNSSETRLPYGRKCQSCKLCFDLKPSIFLFPPGGVITPLALGDFSACAAAPFSAQYIDSIPTISLGSDKREDYSTMSLLMSSPEQILFQQNGASKEKPHYWQFSSWPLCPHLEWAQHWVWICIWTDLRRRRYCSSPSLPSQYLGSPMSLVSLPLISSISQNSDWTSEAIPGLLWGTLGQAEHLWQELFHVYLPQALSGSSNNCRLCRFITEELLLHHIQDMNCGDFSSQEFNYLFDWSKCCIKWREGGQGWNDLLIPRLEVQLLCLPLAPNEEFQIHQLQSNLQNAAEQLQRGDLTLLLCILHHAPFFSPFWAVWYCLCSLCSGNSASELWELQLDDECD